MTFWQELLIATVPALIAGVVGYIAGRSRERRQRSVAREGRLEDELKDWRLAGAAASAQIQTEILGRFRSDVMRPLPYEQRLQAYAGTLAGWHTHRTELRRIAAGHPFVGIVKACTAVEAVIRRLVDLSGRAIEMRTAAEAEPPSVAEVMATLDDPSALDALRPSSQDEISEAWAEIEEVGAEAYGALETLRTALQTSPE